MSTMRDLLGHTAGLAADWLDGLEGRPVARPVVMAELVAALGGALPERGADPHEVVAALARAVEPGLVATTSGRYFGFVEGGVLPAALAADWLTSTWDQNPAYAVLSPAAAAAEEVCRGWLCELLGLPATCSAGFTTGAQMANVAGLAAARARVLGAVGWDVGADGLNGAPAVRVVVGEQRHATVGRALRLLGLGERAVVVVPADGQGRMRVEALADALTGGPTIVVAQAGNVNTGAFDPVGQVCDVAHEHDAWVHVDGAFGLWAAASPALRHLTAGAERADSWAVDGHKWLNVPYDCGIVLCAHPERHRGAMALSAPYLARTGDRDGSDWTPESSRRARAFSVWAALRGLGRAGVAELVERCCAHARRFAEQLAADPAVTVCNEVVLNQVLVRIGDDDTTRAVAAAVQRRGHAWLGTTAWQGAVALRVSVSDHATTDRHVDEAVAEVLAAVHSERR